MKTEKDKEIDDLFKQGLEQPNNHPGNMDGDWDAMEQMLDERKKRPVIIYWLPILGSVAALLLVLIGWWLLKPVVTHPKQTQQIAAMQQKAKHEKKGNEQQQTAKNIDTVTLDVIKPQGLPGGGSSNANIANNINATKHNRSYNHANGPILKNDYVTGQQDNPALAQQNASYRQTGADLVAYKPTMMIGQSRETEGIIKPVDVLPQDYSNKSVYVAKNRKKIASYPYKPQFAITVLASSDKNSVSSFQQTKPGNNAGLLLSVGVFKRFTISTGAIYSAKQYMSDFADYHTTYQFQTNPVSVLADCKMFDIPLNIDYRIFDTYRNKISIGTGVSSYLMLHESYQFSYAGYSDGPSHYNVANPNKYLLSIVNLQATYERQINSNVGITFQPYMKLPLSAVGASQVRLQTTGIAIGLTWNLKSSSKP